MLFPLLSKCPLGETPFRNSTRSYFARFEIKIADENTKFWSVVNSFFGKTYQRESVSLDMDSRYHCRWKVLAGMFNKLFSDIVKCLKIVIKQFLKTRLSPRLYFWFDTDIRKQVHNSSYQKLKIGNSKEQLFSYFFITIRLFSSAFSSIFENTDRTPVDKRKDKENTEN